MSSRCEARGPWGLHVSMVVTLLLLGTTRASAQTVMPDSAGMGAMEWAYDVWTVPWVQVRGMASALAPTSHATLMVLACQTANLERDRLARHLSREECEHRLAAIRADQDSSLIFRMDLRVFDFPGSSGIARLDQTTTVILEDDQGRTWMPTAIVRGPARTVRSAPRLPTIYYEPPWSRAARHSSRYQYGTGPTPELTVVEHRVRFARRDRRWGDLVLSSRTRWLRLRYRAPRHEWIATWTFRDQENRSP